MAILPSSDGWTLFYTGTGMLTHLASKCAAKAKDKGHGDSDFSAVLESVHDDGKA